MTLTRMAATAAAVLTVAFGISVVGTSPAAAHDSCITRDWGGGCVSLGHQRVGVNDWACDGHEVRVRVQFRNGTYASVFDPAGCDPEAGGVKIFERTVARYRLCADGIGCTAWKAA